MFKSLYTFAGMVFFALGLLSACSSQPEQSIDESKKIVFGTTIGDFGDMVKESIIPQLEKKGYQVTLKEFSDYVLLNKSLAEKNIDINVFQHRPYFYYFIKQQNLDLVEAFEAPTAALGIYSGKSTDLNTDKAELTIGIPNDPTNLARALLLLDDIGYIKINPEADKTLVTTKDIQTYNRPIKLVEIEAAQLPRSRDDLDFAVINGNYAKSSGIDLTTALAQEKGKEYINIAAIRTQDKDSKWIKDVQDAYNSDEFKAYAKEKFKGYNYPENW
ncbi:hypothetical protein GKC56_06505 [Neisseriaceae bacterium PsAf]|nr:hypothetical protein [Neisseriaceae bacterium PsAf]MCV2503780.1 MetQ/NlpA family ABC transporter substrate-binding protein [Neisseriaceae bacterium]